jgi:hypothetical protein
MTPSRISKIYDWFLSEVAAALPDHSELMDPDDLTENPDGLLAKGYGITIGAGQNTNRCIEANAYYYQRDFTIILTRDLVRLQADSDSRKEKWKNILEDLHLVLQRLTGSYSIVEGTSVISFKNEYSSDSGPRATVINGNDYVFIELTVTAEYRETKSGG